jgi:hypothetical protein
VVVAVVVLVVLVVVGQSSAVLVRALLVGNVRMAVGANQITIGSGSVRKGLVVMCSRFARGGVAALLSTIGLVVVAACSGSDDGGGTAGTSPSSPAVSTPPTTPSAPVSTPASTPASTGSAKAAGLTIDVTIVGGKVTPSAQTFKVSQGQTVQINVTSDANDEVHVHGYDKELPVTPGKPASVTFTADTKGTFEIETHESNKLIGKLIVS